MHDCPKCGMACYCSGDIEDHDTGPEYEGRCRHQCSDAAGDDLGEPERDELVFDCGDPECCMPGPHYRSECHTARDIIALEPSDPQPPAKKE